MMKMIDIANRLGYLLRCLFVIVILSSLSFNASAQGGSGSVYSIFGIGEVKPTLSVQARGMGGASIGLSGKYFVNVVNPAANDMVSEYANHLFDAGLYFSSTTLKTDDASDNVSSGGLSNLSFWFKINDRWNSILGLSQFSDVGYNILDQDITTFEDNTANVLYQGSGGLNELYMSNGFRVVDNLSLGVKLAFVFGNIEHKKTITSSQISTNYEDTDETQIKGVYAEYSLNYKVVTEKYYLNFGLLYKQPTSLTGSVGSMLVEQGFEDAIFEETHDDEEYIVPRKVGFGTSFNTEKFTVTGEVQYNEWSQAKVSGDDGDLIDTWKYATGLEITPNRSSDKVLKRMSYRMGGYYENFYLKVGGIPILAYGFTGGLAIPLRQGSTLNISYEQRINGTTTSNLILESTNEVTVNMTIRNRWFQTRKYN